MGKRAAVIAAVTITAGFGFLFLAETLLVGSLILLTGVYALVLPHLIEPRETPTR